MQKAAFISVTLGIMILSSGCTVAHSGSYGRSYHRIAITAPIYEVHHPVRHRYRHVEAPRCPPPRRHHGHGW